MKICHVCIPFHSFVCTLINFQFLNRMAHILVIYYMDMLIYMFSYNNKQIIFNC